MSIKILLADDHPIVRRGLRALLEAEADLQVVAEVEDGLAALEAVEQWQPDVLVLDLVMPGLNGLDVALQTEKRSPGTRVVVLSMYSTEAYVLQALRNGAAAYVLKKSSPDELVLAIREVMAGRPFLSRALSVRAIESYRQQAKEMPLEAYDRLTRREREVFHLAAEGHTNGEIGDRLSISPRTVEMHRANLMEKLKLSNQAELIRYALQRGILPMEGE